MKNEIENKRRLFLSQACLPILASILGIPLVNGCVVERVDDDHDFNGSHDDDDDDHDDDHDDHDDHDDDHDDDDDDDDDDDNNHDNGNSTTTSVVINLTQSTFKDISSVGGWMNYTAKNLLLVRVSETTIRAFNNACPHEGVRTRWTFNGTRFQCHEHNRTFNNNCNGSLNCYNTTIEGSTLTISNTN